MPVFFRNSLLLLISVISFGCGSNGPVIFEFMPTPAAYTDTGLKIVNQDALVADTPVDYVFYATDRAPVSAKGKSHFYSNKRGNAVRLGKATIGTGRDDLTWEDARRVSLLKTRTEKFPILVESTEEYGLLKNSVHPFTNISQSERDGAANATKRYTSEINQKLATSKQKCINIFVHGYKVTFENPILTTAEMWHFLGYDGVFIAYSWPSTPKALAYVSDTETALVSSRHLRDLVRHLAQNTNAERINIIGYSAGSRLVSRMLGDLTLQEQGRSRSEIRRRLKLGTVAIIAGDVDRKLVGGYLLDGADKLMDQFLIYQSDSDKALSVSNFLTNRSRLGQTFDLENLNPKGVEYLKKHPNVVIVDVSNAEAARAGNGHGYLRKSPWVTSDLLYSVAYGAKPEERGLVKRDPNIPLWTFPSDYIDRLAKALRKQHPEWFE